MRLVLVKEKCFLCGREFDFGPHVYDGKFLSSYKISLCMNCYNSNYDGYAANNGNKIIKHLTSMNLDVPELNSKGLLPRE